MNRFTAYWLDHHEHIVGGSMSVLSLVGCVLIFVSAYTQPHCPVPRWAILTLSLVPVAAMTWLTIQANRPSAYLVPVGAFLFAGVIKTGHLCPNCGAWMTAWSRTTSQTTNDASGRHEVTRGRGGASCPSCGYSFENDFLSTRKRH